MFRTTHQQVKTTGILVVTITHRIIRIRIPPAIHTQVPIQQLIVI